MKDTLLKYLDSDVQYCNTAVSALDKADSMRERERVVWSFSRRPR
jgi:hypothetical protein